MNYSSVEISREPANWRDETAIEPSFEEDRLISVFSNRSLQNIMTCSFCFGRLSVAPICYDIITLNKVCGRCVRNRPSGLQVLSLLRDHMYEKLLPHFVFECSRRPCDMKLKWDEVEEHERNCIFEWPHEPDENHWNDFLCQNDDNEFVTVPKTKTLHEALSCHLCAKSLSVFPVFSNGQNFICGRCERPKIGHWTVQILYELIAPYLKIPCHRNVNCTQILSVNEAEAHEWTCRWRFVPCPMPSCDKSKPECEIPIHIRHDHLHECKDRLELMEQTALFKIDSVPFIVSLKAVDELQVSCTVHGLELIDYDDLRLQIVDGKNSVLQCLPIQVATKWNLNPVNIKRAGENRFLHFVKVENDEGVALDEESSQEFKCNVCYSYMTRTIFICENRHPICDRCKPKVASCPMCRGWLDNDTNPEMESRAANFKFPCALQEDNNCDVVLTPKFLAKHEIVCRPIEDFPFKDGCVFGGCGTTFDRYRYDEFFNHCAELHLGSVMYSGGREILKWSTIQGRTYRRAMLFFEGELFCVTVEVTVHCGVNLGLSFAIVHVVSCSKRYKYTLELYASGRAVEYRGTCDENSESADLYVEPEYVEDFANIGPATDSGPAFAWLDYRVKLEQDFSRQ